MLRSWAIYQLCQSMPGTAQGQVGTKHGQLGTRQGQTGINRDKHGHSLFVPACPYLSLSLPVYSCLSLLVLVCPCFSLSVPVRSCLSLFVSTFAMPSSLPLHMTITVIGMNILTLTFFAKATVPMHTNLF